MSDSNHEVGEQIAFHELFAPGRFPIVQIPIIQRDYAQGRAGQEELRKAFLDALRTALDRDEHDERVPLDLDFVYGSALPSSGKQHSGFAPLDGQQRLTTLFLLHWYLAWRDGEIADFRERFVDGQRLRFCYEVRPSSHDFFQSLALTFPIELAAETPSLKALIMDQTWFFQAWVHDPTVDSALTMLDEIHRTFGDCQHGYARLTRSARPRITFQLLRLEHLGLSDDLYIKMNARGKELTPFENFKARLEQHLADILPNATKTLRRQEVSMVRYFNERIDGAWADLFWHRQRDVFDKELMRLIKAVVLVSLNPEDPKMRSTLESLRDLDENISFSRYSGAGCLHETALLTLVQVLDHFYALQPEEWKAEDALYDNDRAFREVTAGELSYPELTNFAAYCTYLSTHTLPVDQSRLAAWLRVASNLVENSGIERPEAFLAALRSLRQCAARADDILDALVDGTEIAFFNQQQVREERIKAALLRKGGRWRELIGLAEGHGYFRGQIEFLLSYSGILHRWVTEKTLAGSEEEQTAAQVHFSFFLERATLVFDDKGLRRFEENLWERALLALGDYLLESGKNRSFLHNQTGAGWRRPTWKLLLRGDGYGGSVEQSRALLGSLLEKMDPVQGIESSLRNVIDETKVTEEWRAMLVEVPELLAYCEQKMLRECDDGSIYLLSGRRIDSEHVELWTLHLDRTLLAPMETEGVLAPFIREYHGSCTEDRPFGRLRWRGRSAAVWIDWARDVFRLTLEGADARLHQTMRARLQERLLPTTDGTLSVAHVASHSIKVFVRDLVFAAREYDLLATAG